MAVTEETPQPQPIRVETLANSNLIPPQYIQPPHTRPSAAAPTTATIPLIDLSLSSAAISADISAACRDWGAFHVVNHGVPIHLLDEIRTVGSSFFNDLDVSEKLKYGCDGSGAASEGYGSRMLVSDNDDVVLDWRDYFDHHTFPLSRRNSHRWPHYPTNYRKVVEEYSEQMKTLAQKLLSLISESLGLHSSCIENAVGEFYQNITISYYPTCPQPELTLGLQSHSDFGAITLLIQDDVGGLEVLKGDEWVTVQPLSHAILVILADQTEVITNGEYKSAIHRAVTNANRARLSVATFHDPDKTRKIAPAPALLEKSAPKYREVLYGEFVKSWYTKGPEGKRNLDALLL
ncbi:hypothetical protein KSS87_008618 [Heliosperma pusillum]|nr:hypothetical protein KSS87_008618 [Heliosperma pusillum]